MNLYNNTLPLIQQISGEVSTIDTTLLGNAADLTSQVVSLITSLDKVESTLSSYEGKYKGSLTSTFFGTMAGGNYWTWIAGGALILLGGAYWFSRRK
jgi:hypothetical protein